jgi:hypothetical protein
LHNSPTSIHLLNHLTNSRVIIWFWILAGFRLSLLSRQAKQSRISAELPV